MSKIELKPCPFCGGRVSMVYNSRENAFKFYHINGNKEERCRVKDTIRPRGKSLKDAAEAWNRRADAVEVVHGRWGQRKSGFVYFCSNCEYWTFQREAHEWHYCPNCGTQMDGIDHE